MIILSRLAFLLIASWFVLIPVLPVSAAAEEDRYGEWKSSDDRLKNMIDELDRVIQEGTRSRAAHPGFLQDLNRIIDQYRIPTRIVFFSDDFADNDYTANPTWTVRKGTFTIDSSGSLYSSIPVSKPEADERTESESEGDKNLRILLGVLNELTKDEDDPQGTGNRPRAIIGSEASIPNSFILQFSFTSNSNWGSTSIGVLSGNKLRTGYHIVYRPSPAEKRPLRLIRYNNGKPYIIAEVYENSPDLDDGLDHIVQLTRSAQGDMVINIDNTEVMRTADFSDRDDFSGIVIINNGGSYSYDNIEFYAEQ